MYDDSAAAPVIASLTLAGNKKTNEMIWPELSIRTLLGDYGEIETLVIKRQKSGKGKAIVEFASLRAARQAIYASSRYRDPCRASTVMVLGARWDCSQFESASTRGMWEFTMAALGVDGTVHKSLITRTDFETVDEMNKRRRTDRAAALARMALQEETDATI